MATRLRQLQYRKVALVNRGANQEAHISLFKRDDTMAKEQTLAEVQAALAAANEEKAELEARLAKLAPPKEPDLPEAVRKQVEAAESRAKAAEERIAKLEEGRAREQAIQKAHSLKALGAADDLGSILYEIRKAVPATVADKVETLLAGWNEQLAQSDLFKEIGSGEKGDKDPEARLDALAKKYQVDHAGTSYEQAYGEVCKTAEGKALYAQSLKGR